MARIPTCHPSRKHRAHGLCVNCYHVAYSLKRYKENAAYFHDYYKQKRRENPEAWHALVYLKRHGGEHRV